MYKSFYNLNARPFGLKPDLRYFYATRPHQRAIVHMHAGLEQPDGVLVLTGAKGSGKTTLITHMLAQLDRSNSDIAFIPKPPEKDHDFLPGILTGLGIPVSGNDQKALFNTLHKFLLEQAKQNKKVLLVVDDVEILSPNCFAIIRLLSTLTLNNRGLLQIVLIGGNELEVILSANNNQAFRQQISMYYCMRPLQAQDTREYIEHRLKIAGWNGSPIFDEDSYPAIHQSTGGLPYAINRYCDGLLMLGMLRKNPQISVKDVSNLTDETLEKLKKFEKERMEQDKHKKTSNGVVNQSLPSNPVTEKTAESENIMKGLQAETNIFMTPPSQNGSFFTKQKITIAVAACIVASAAVVFFDFMPKNAPGSGHKTASDSHTAVTAHSTADSHSSSHNSHSFASDPLSSAHESGSGPGKYILSELPHLAHSSGTGENGDSKIQLLDIQQLLNKSGTSELEDRTAQFENRPTGDAISYASDTPFQTSSEPASELHSQPVSHGAHEFASNAD